MKNTNPLTGLTPKQERAVQLQITGKSITQIAQELKIDRGTLYNWSEAINYQSYLNKLMAETQRQCEIDLLSLRGLSFEAIVSCLNSENEAIKIKTAMWIFTQLANLQTGETNPQKVIESQCQNQFAFIDLDQSKYEALMKENNL